MPSDNPNIAIDRALSQVEGFLHLHHGTACLDEGGESFLLLDCAQAIARLREARDALGITSCPPVTLILPPFHGHPPKQRLPSRTAPG